MVRQFVAPGDDDVAGQDDKHTRTNLAGCRQAFARAVGPRLPEPAQPIDLRRLQHQEHLVAPSLDDRVFRCRHGRPLHSQNGVEPFQALQVNSLRSYRPSLSVSSAQLSSARTVGLVQRRVAFGYGSQQRISLPRPQA